MKMKLFLSTTMIVGFIALGGLENGTQAIALQPLSSSTSQGSLIQIRHSGSHTDRNVAKHKQHHKHHRHDHGSKVDKHSVHKHRGHHPHGSTVDKLHHGTQVGKHHKHHHHGSSVGHKHPVHR